MRLRYSIVFLATIAWPSVHTLNPSKFHNKRADMIRGLVTEDEYAEVSIGMHTRRQALATFATISSTLLVSNKSAIAETLKPQEFVSVGTQAPTPDGENPFVALPNGVKIKDIRIGSGDGSVGKDSRVSIQCSGRLLNLNGVVFYNTKNNNPDGFGAIPLTFDLGKGQAVPGLESGLIGMKKGGIRRIIVPQELAYNKFPDLEPKPMNANDQRALDSIVKNSRRDGSILFDVQLERLK
eukprot:scaffold23479_cov143-Cylindrotheca_fusiformis.AAC.18